MSDDRGRADANHCFVCGPENQGGLRLQFLMDGDVCRSRFTPERWQVGYDDMVHGGIVFSVLDDVMANWFFLQGIRAHTAKCEIRYRQPVSLGTELDLTGRLSRRKGRMAVMEGTAARVSDGQVVADARGSFMIVSD